MCPAFRAALNATGGVLLLACCAAPAAAQCSEQSFITSLRSTASDGKSFSIAWDPVPSALSLSSDASAGYEILVRTGSRYCTLGPAIVSATTTATSFTLPLTSPDAAYGVYVRLQGDPCTTTEYMLMADSFTSPPSRPDPPAIFIEDNQVTLNFNYSDDRAFGIDVERADSDGRFRYVGTLRTCAANPKIFSQGVPDGRHIYRLGVANAATRASGEVYSAPIPADVGVTGLPVIHFAATPSAIVAGQSTVLTFEAAGSTSVTIDHGLGAQLASGSIVVAPTATTAYTLTASNSAGSVSSIVTVNVSAGPSRRRGVSH